MRRIRNEGVNAGLVRRVEISLEYHTAREMRNGGACQDGGVCTRAVVPGGDMREGGHESARRMENAINSHHQQRARE